MSASGATTNYNLSQFISTDIPSWLGDYNGDMLKIDTGINGAKLAADSAALVASAAQNDATSALNNVGTLSTTVGTLSNTVGTAVGNINTINSLIGNGTPTTTDQTIIGAINELHADQGDLSDLVTTDNTSFVNAINEIAQSSDSWTEFNAMTDVPATASEIKMIGEVEGTYFENVFDYSLFTSTSAWYCVGGYYATAGDNYSLNVQATNSAISQAAATKGGVAKTATMKYFYR